MIQIICFSFNRAMQLDTLLTSFLEKWESPKYKIDVVYNYTDSEFGEGYNIAIEKFQSKDIQFHREMETPDKYTFFEFLCLTNVVRLYRNRKLRHPKSNFRTLVIKLMEESPYDNIMFLTDDSMFIHSVKISNEIFSWLSENPEQCQFSLRMGGGTGKIPAGVVVKRDLCHWDMYGGNSGGWGYPFSVDAHIYNKAFILNLFKKYVFTNPNTLEANICSTVIRKRLLSQAQCFVDIKMLTFPINMVQTDIDNICQGVSVEDLNNRYLAGETMVYGLDSDYDATKQYVSYLLFRGKDGKEIKVPINPNPDIRPNS